MAIVLIYRHKVKHRKWRFFSAFCALWLPFTLVNLTVALSVIIHDWSWQSTYYVAISNVLFFIRTQEQIIEAQSFSHATLNKRRQWPLFLSADNGMWTSKSVQTVVETTNQSQKTNLESKPTALDDKAPETGLIERGENQLSIGHRVHVFGYWVPSGLSVI